MKRPSLALAALVSLTLALAGCGNSGTDDGSTDTSSGDSAAAVSDAEAIVEADTADVPFIGPDSTPAPEEGKSIGVVVCAGAASGCTRVADGVTSAAELLGWSVTVFDGQGLASAQNTAVQQAISQGVDGIVLVAIPSANISQAMTAARDADVPVVSVEADNTVGDSGTDVFAEPASGSLQAGKDLGAFVIADSGGEANVAILHTTEFPSTVNRYEAFVEQLEGCSTCTIADEQTYLLSSAVTDVPLQVSSILQANPEVNYLFVDVGQFGALAVQSIESANKDVKVVSVDCNPDDIQSIREGGAQAACAAHGLETGGYAALDELNRAMAGEGPSGDTVVPTKLIISSNVPEGDTWQGDFDPDEAYGELWGV